MPHRAALDEGTFRPQAVPPWGLHSVLCGYRILPCHAMAGTIVVVLVPGKLIFAHAGTGMAPVSQLSLRLSRACPGSAGTNSHDDEMPEGAAEEVNVKQTILLVQPGESLWKATHR